MNTMNGMSVGAAASVLASQPRRFAHISPAWLVSSSVSRKTNRPCSVVRVPCTKPLASRGGLQAIETGDTAVVIADHGDVGHFQRGHCVCEIGVGIGLAPMGEIAAHDCEGGVGVMLVDVGNRRVQPGAWVEAIQLQPGVR